jgi:hypothetical protein
VFAQELRRHLRRWRSSPTAQPMIRYEDLVERPAPTLAGLFGRLGLDDREETVASVLERAGADMPERQRRHQSAPDARESIGRWRQDLPPEIERACQESLAGLIGELGY